MQQIERDGLQCCQTRVHIHTMLKFLVLQGALYIYDISRLRVTYCSCCGLSVGSASNARQHFSCDSVINDSCPLGCVALFTSKYLPTFQRHCALQKCWRHGFHRHCSEKMSDVAIVVTVSHQTTLSLCLPLCLPPFIGFHSFFFVSSLSFFAFLITYQ
jgi:hypothetical protein